MKSVNRKILELLIDSAAEPLMVVRLDHQDWPVVLSNQAINSFCNDDVVGRPFPDVIATLTDRDVAVDVSETFRAQQESRFPVTLSNSEYMLSLKPLQLPNDDSARYYGVYWHSMTATSSRDAATEQALLRAKQKIRDLTRVDAVTGLLNATAFREVLEHDWAVASRENSTLALLLFTLDDFNAYVDVFGRHAGDSCRRRVGQAIKRCMRRASDVVGTLNERQYIVLSHASEEDGVRDFAERIAATVRELGLHHPRSGVDRFVTVQRAIALTEASGGTAATFLAGLLEGQ